MSDLKRDDSVEKAVEKDSYDYSVNRHDRKNFDATDIDGVQRRLKQRHVQMIAVSPRLAQIFLA